MNWLRYVLNGASAAGSALLPARHAPSKAGNAAASGPDPTLVKALKSDHRKLLDTHARIGRLMSERRYIDIPAALIALRMRLETHVLTENVRLYSFLERAFKGDPARLAELAEFRSETNAVLVAVLKFVKHHRRTTFDESRLLSFVDEHRQVGAALTRHAAQEESRLYPLYPQAWP